jgi:hypothetical protein
MASYVAESSPTGWISSKSVDHVLVVLPSTLYRTARSLDIQDQEGFEHELLLGSTF